MGSRREGKDFIAALTSSVALLLMWSWGVTLAAPLTTTTAAYHTLADEQILDGIIEPVRQSTVSAEFVGRIVEINFDVDDFVPQGSVLIRFRDNEQRARLAQGKAALEEAKARQIEARQEYKRIQNLVAKKLVAQADMDRATAALNSAVARLAAAEAQVKVAAEQLDRTVIKAPYAGFVVGRHVEVGETVQVGQALMTGLSLQDLRVTVRVPQSFIAAVSGEDRARIIFPGDGQPDVTVEHLTVFPYADPLSHTVKVRMNLPKDLQGVRSGSFVKVAFITGESRHLLVPRLAVTHRSELTAVYVIDKDGGISLRQVRTGQERSDDMIEVLSGLQEGDNVVLDPVQAGLALKERQAAHGE
jgi:membrane fusion protein, multidrug efflux system